MLNTHGLAAVATVERRPPPEALAEPRKVVKIYREKLICTAAVGLERPCYGVLRKLSASSSKCPKCGLIYILYEEPQNEDMRLSMSETRRERWTLIERKKIRPFSYSQGGRVA